MENALLVGLSRQMVLGRSIDVVANNIANMNTTGFKSDNSLFEEYLMPVARENRFNPADRMVSFVNDSGAWHNLGPGPLQQTGNPLDVAINGDGMFVVQTPAGERYTRDGGFQLDNQGQLVNASGYPVLGNNGPVRFQQTDKQINIAADGTITVLEGTNRIDSIRAKLRIVNFTQPQRLRKEGSNLYSLGEGNAAQPDTKSVVHQGFIERSNVNSIHEMSRLIEVSRTYTQIASMLQQQHDLHRTAIDKLAEVPA